MQRLDSSLSPRLIGELASDISLPLCTSNMYAPAYVFVYRQLIIYFQVSGGLLFVVAMLAWYLTCALILAEMAFPFNLPVFDLSHFWPQPDLDLEKAEPN